MPGTCFDPCHQPVRELRGCRDIAPDHLDVDRRRQAEIQDLADDIGRQKEKVTPGNSLRQCSTADHGCTPRSDGGLRLSDTMISASPGPIGAELLYERLMPL